MERVAWQLVEVLRANPDKDIVEHAEKKACFKVKITDSGAYILKTNPTFIDLS